MGGPRVRTVASQLLIVCGFTATVVFVACVDRTTDPGSIWISLTLIHRGLHLYSNFYSQKKSGNETSY